MSRTKVIGIGNFLLVVVHVRNNCVGLEWPTAKGVATVKWTIVHDRKDCCLKQRLKSD